MTTLTHPVYGLRLCANGDPGHESVFMMRTVKKGNPATTRPQIEVPLHIKIVKADAESVGRAVIELLELHPESEH